MKKIIIMVVVCSVLLFGCADDTISKENEYFITIDTKDDHDLGIYSIVYAKDTKVKYLIWRNGYRTGITPLYNADGSLQIYEEREKETKQ